MKIYLNKNANLEKIVKVLLKVLGNDLIYKNIDNKEIDINKETNKDNVWSLALTNEVKNISATELVNNMFLFHINVKDANHKLYRGTVFLDLPDDEYLAIGKFDKLLDFDSNPITITFGKRLVDFFGGELIADNFEYKNKKPKFYNLLKNEPILELKEILKNQEYASYNLKEEDLHFLIKSDYDKLNKELNIIKPNNNKKIKI
jgi:hypothetical protein